MWNQGSELRTREWNAGCNHFGCAFPPDTLSWKTDIKRLPSFRLNSCLHVHFLKISDWWVCFSHLWNNTSASWSRSTSITLLWSSSNLQLQPTHEKNTRQISIEGYPSTNLTSTLEIIKIKNIRHSQEDHKKLITKYNKVSWIRIWNRKRTSD